MVQGDLSALGYGCNDEQGLSINYSAKNNIFQISGVKSRHKFLILVAVISFLSHSLIPSKIKAYQSTDDCLTALCLGGSKILSFEFLVYEPGKTHFTMPRALIICSFLNARKFILIESLILSFETCTLAFSKRREGRSST